MHIKEKRAHLLRGEGLVDHMYLDTEGVVTVGVGNALFDEEHAIELDFRHKTKQLKNRKAEPDEIEAEFYRVKYLPIGKSARFYDDHTDLKLEQKEIKRLFDKRINEFEELLNDSFTSYKKQPKEAQIALLDMAYNLGTSGLKRKFPRFCEAFVNKDWETCALECNRRGISDARNQETENLFRELMKNDHE